MWLSSQNNQNICWCAIRLVGMAFFGFVLTACSDLSIHQLDQENQNSLKKITVADIGSREGQIYTRELRKKLHIGGKTSEVYFLNSTITTTSPATLSVQGAASSLKKMSMTITFELNDVDTGQTLFPTRYLAMQRWEQYLHFMVKTNQNLMHVNGLPFCWPNVWGVAYSVIF